MPLQPVSTIDFASALNVKQGSKRLSIWRVAASQQGPLVLGGASLLLLVARATRNGRNVSRVDIQLPGGSPGSLAARPDGTFWILSTWRDPLSEPEVFPGQIGSAGGAPVVLWKNPTAAGNAPFNPHAQQSDFYFYAGNGRAAESFHLISQIRGEPVDIAVSADELAVVYPGMIRAGHVSGSNFTVDREWQVHGGHLIFPFGAGRFAVVNRASGEFTIIDPTTPDALIVKTPFAEPNHRRAPLVTADGGSIWYLLAGPSHDNRDLVGLAPDGAIVSRTTIALPPGIKPLRLAISGRDIYIAGVGATIYRYELPQFE